MDVVELFREADGHNWMMNAVVNPDLEDDTTLAHGYQHALDAVVADWQAGNRFDFVVPAIVLLGRHAIELALKGGIRVAEAELGRRTTDPVLAAEVRETWMRKTAGHDLSKLRDELLRLLSRLGEEPLPSEVNEVIDSLAALDPSGDSFRYSNTWDRQSSSTVRTPRPRGKDGMVNVVALGRRLSEVTTTLLIVQDVITHGRPDL